MNANSEGVDIFRGVLSVETIRVEQKFEFLLFAQIRVHSRFSNVEASMV